MAITFVITNAGRNALVNAANTGTAPVTIAQAGLSSAAVAPSPTTANLSGEFKRIGTLSGDIVADDTIHLIVRDESSDVFTLRSIALYLADGTLFGIYGQSEILLEKSSQALMLLAVDIRFEDVAAGNISFGNANFLNPPATTERQGVIELATVAEAQAGNDAIRAITPASAKAAITNWLGFSPIQQGTGVGQLGNVIKIGWSGSRLKATVDATDQGNVVFDTNLAGGYLGVNASYAARNGNHLWGPDNDGSGSGLDADLLDGIHAASFARVDAGAGATFVGGLVAPYLRSSGDASIAGTLITTNLRIPGSAGQNGLSGGNGDGAGYSTFNLALDVHWGLGIRTHNGSVNGFYDARGGFWDVLGDYRIRGVPVWHPSNDGSGSGLDADLLDGQDSGYYTNIVARLGFAPIQQGGGIGQNGNKIYIGWGSNRLKATVDATDQGPIVTDEYLAAAALTVNGAQIRRAGHNLWGPDNDGAGSGLDADLLDGHDSAYFADIASRLGFAPVRQGTGIGQRPNTVNIGWSDETRLKCTVDNLNLGNFVFDGNIADVWRAGNDGSGSGLDADLLDGQDGSYYSDIAGRLGYNPVRQGTGVGQAANIVKIGWSAQDRLKCTVDDHHIGDFVFDGNIADVWRASNDGSGSGLDADLLDGFQASSFARVDAGEGATFAGGVIAPYLRSTGEATVDLAVTSGQFRTSGGGGTNGISGGNGDGASFTTFNLAIDAHWGIGLRTYDGSVNGIYDARGGFWDVLGDYRIRGVPVWHPSNDGSGSGLDADLLDGQDGNFYTNIPARLGYSPVSRSGDTMTGPLLIQQGGNAYLSITSSGVATAQLSMQSDGNLVLYRNAGNGPAAAFSVGSQSGPFAVQMPMTRQGHTVWDGGNDGSGSGLDADLLDGQDGGYYTNIVARLGFMPIQQGGGVGQTSNKLYIGWGGNRLRATVDATDQGPIVTDEHLAAASLTVNGAQVRRAGNNLWGPDNDGSGSGLDADLLDGQDSGYFTNIPARLGYSPVQQGGGVGQLASKIFMGWDGNRLRATVDVTDQGPLVTDAHLSGGGRDVNGAQMKRGGNHLWGPDNDGSGSALDADLLDGYQADAFTRVVSQNMAAIDGYRVFADGTKECWTRISIGQHQYATWTLPVPHESFVHPSLGCTTAGGNSEVQDNTGITVINGDPPTSITFWNADDRTITVYVRTIGR